MLVPEVYNIMIQIYWRGNSNPLRCFYLVNTMGKGPDELQSTKS